MSRRDRLPGPLRGQRGAPARTPPAAGRPHAQIVVAGQADRRVLAGQLHAGVGLGAVADEIAEAPELLAVGGARSRRAPRRRHGGCRGCRKRSRPACCTVSLVKRLGALPDLSATLRRWRSPRLKAARRLLTPAEAMPTAGAGRRLATTSAPRRSTAARRYRAAPAGARHWPGRRSIARRSRAGRAARRRRCSPAPRRGPSRAVRCGRCRGALDRDDRCRHCRCAARGPPARIAAGLVTQSWRVGVDLAKASAIQARFAAAGGAPWSRRPAASRAAGGCRRPPDRSLVGGGAGRAGAGRPRPAVQRLHAAARRRDAHRRARAGRAAGVRSARCTRSTPAGAPPPPTPT